MSESGDSTAALGFGREHRLLTPAEFAEVFSARQVLRGRLFALHYRLSGRPGARLGLVIPKKQARSAVLRNAIKRQARECFRLQHSLLPPMDLILRLALPITGGSVAVNPEARTAWRLEVLALFDRLGGRLKT